MKTEFTGQSMEKLKALRNKRVEEKIASAIRLCKPDKVTVLTDSRDDAAYIRQLALKNGEEQQLAAKGHTVHFDGYYDQGRDKEHTKCLLPKCMKSTKYMSSLDRTSGLKEIFSFLDGIMKGKEMFLCFYSLGPAGSAFSIPALQLTDSAYVVHSENILYRPGYSQFKGDFFFFLHSAGRLGGIDVDKRRIYIDLQDNSVYSVNTQYAGNSMGLKKLSLRLAIKKAYHEGWLAEHMFIMAAHAHKRKTYFTGAFPSACGKTSTAMLSGHSIIGDDIAYIKKYKGTAYAANPECGMFGIITNVNPKDDPVLYKALTTPKEVIFSNVLAAGGKPYWLGMGSSLPGKGVNFSGSWSKGKKGPDGREVPPAHPNARFTMHLKDLSNLDSMADSPEGVPVSGFIFGGRDSDTSVPVLQSLNWKHGVLLAASLESETTSATLGKQGERIYNPMANQDFLSITLSDYIRHYLRFGAALKKPPIIFSVNYFLKENGKYLNGMLDKKVWLMWMEQRVHNELGAIKTPVGYMPKYEDLKQMFNETLGTAYKKQDYEKQFAIRTKKLLEKFGRIEKIFAGNGAPPAFMSELKNQIKRLKGCKKSIIAPSDLAGR